MNEEPTTYPASITVADPMEYQALTRLLHTLRSVQRRLGTLNFNWAFEVRRQGREVHTALTRIPNHVLDPDEAQP
jgi:hypothetical protein